MLRLQLPKALNSALSVRNLQISSTQNHFSSKKKNHQIAWDPNYFYDGVDLPPKEAPKNVRNYKFGKYAVLPRTRVRLVDNSQIAIAGMKWYRKPCILEVIKPNQGLERGKRDIRGTAKNPNKLHHGRVGDLCHISVNHQVAKCLIVGSKCWSGDHGFKSRQDSVNGVILNNELEPIANRIMVPLPGWLRDCKRMPQGIKPQYNKLFAIAAKGYY